jgi:hypothetical protein
MRHPVDETHWCEWDAYGRLKVRALCGVYIRRRDHSPTPTCVICQQALAARERSDNEPLAEQ